jgi:hypothetical protein
MSGGAQLGQNSLQFSSNLEAVDNNGDAIAPFADSVMNVKILAEENKLTFSGRGGNDQDVILTGLAYPVESKDAATKNYVDSVASGLRTKLNCRVATNARLLSGAGQNFSYDASAGTLTGPENEDVQIDGKTLSVGDRVLVKDQDKVAVRQIALDGDLTLGSITLAGGDYDTNTTDTTFDVDELGDLEANFFIQISGTIYPVDSVNSGSSQFVVAGVDLSSATGDVSFLPNTFSVDASGDLDLSNVIEDDGISFSGSDFEGSFDSVSGSTVTIKTLDTMPSSTIASGATVSFLDIASDQRGSQNGIYVCTQVGEDSSSQLILRRSDDFGYDPLAGEVHAEKTLDSENAIADNKLVVTMGDSKWPDGTPVMATNLATDLGDLSVGVIFYIQSIEGEENTFYLRRTRNKTGDSQAEGDIIDLGTDTPAATDKIIRMVEIDGLFTFIKEGTANAGSGFVCTTDHRSDGSQYIGDDAHSIEFAQFSSAGVYVGVENEISIDSSLNIGLDENFQKSDFSNFAIAISEGAGNSLNLQDSNDSLVLTSVGTGATAGQNAVIIDASSGGMELKTSTTAYIDATASAGIKAKAFIATSDRNLKTNIKTIEGTLDMVRSDEWRGVEWNWKKDGQRKQRGVVAQEIQKLMPDCVIENDEGFLAVDYNSITGVLMEAIKCATLKIDEQQETIDELLRRTRYNLRNRKN